MAKRKFRTWIIVSLFILSIGIITSVWLYTNHQKSEHAAFEHAEDFVIQKYNEEGILLIGDVYYAIGRGNHFVSVKSKTTQKRYTLEVKIRDDLTLVSIDDLTLNDIHPDDQ